MIPFLSPLILRLIGGRFKWLADIIAVATLIIAALSALAIWLHFHDKGVIADHESVIRTEIIKIESEASAVADEEESKAAVEFGERQEKNRKEIDSAKLDGSSPFDSWNAPDRVQRSTSTDSKATR